MRRYAIERVRITMLRTSLSLSLSLPLACFTLSACDAPQSSSELAPIEFDDVAATGKADGGNGRLENLQPGDRVIIGHRDPSFGLALDAGETIELRVWAEDRHGQSVASRVAIFDPSGELVAEQETEDGEVSELFATASLAGTYRVGVRSWGGILDIQTQCTDCEETSADSCSDTVTYFAGGTRHGALAHDLDIDSCDVRVIEGTPLKLDEDAAPEVGFRPGSFIAGFQSLGIVGHGSVRLVGRADAPIVLEEGSDDYETLFVSVPTHMRYVDITRMHVRADAELILEDTVLRRGSQFDKRLVADETTLHIYRSLLDGVGIEVVDDPMSDVAVIDSVLRRAKHALRVRGVAPSTCGGGTSSIPDPPRPFEGDPRIVRSDIYGSYRPVVIDAKTLVQVEDSNLYGGYHTLSVSADELAPGSYVRHSNIVSTSPIHLATANPDPLLELFDDVYLGDDPEPVFHECRSEQRLDVTGRSGAWIEGLGPRTEGLRPEVESARLVHNR